MPIELTRGHLFIAVFIASVLVLFMLGRQPASPILISTWMPRQQAMGDAASFAPDSSFAAPQAITGLAQAGTTSVPLSLAGDVGFNVLSALGARGGALRSVTIRPGETWSFNATIGSPAYVEVRTVGGVP